MHLLDATEIEAGIVAFGIGLRGLHCERQGIRRQGVAVGNNKAALHDIAQFADIPFPGVPFQNADIVRRNRADGLSHLGRQCGDKRLDMQRDVVHPFTEWRQVNLENRKPVKQVLAKMSIGNFFCQVAVGGGYHAHIHFDRLRIADLEKLAGFENTEQLSLKIERHLADLIEEDRAVVGFFEQAFRLFECTGESSCLVTEHLAFQQVAAERGTVDGDKGFIATGTILMDGLGKHLLAGPGLAGEQDGNIRCGNLACQ